MKNNDNPALRFYGRRKGKTLRIERRAALEEGMSKFQIMLPDNGALKLKNLFSEPKDHYWLEIGFGNGEALAVLAQQNPGTGFLGAEPFVNGQSALMKDIRDNNIQNIRVYPDDARFLLAALPDHSLDKILLLFSDPWPKKRHIRRRFVQPETLDDMARVLKPGSELRLASDDPGLADWMFDLTWHHPDFEWMARTPEDWRKRPVDQPPTRYEQKCLAGKKPVYLIFKRA